MRSTILCGISRVILFPKNSIYTGSLNELHTVLTDTLGTYDFFSYFRLNTELLNLLRILRLNGKKIHFLASGTIQDVPELHDVLAPLADSLFTGKQFDKSKSDPSLYIEIAELLNVPLTDILLIDDTEKHLLAAKSAGVEVFHYHTTDTLTHELTSVFGPDYVPAHT